MTAQTDKKTRIIILFEAYLTFMGESSIREFSQWLIDNKIIGHQYYTARSIANIVRDSYRFKKKSKYSSKWILAR